MPTSTRKKLLKVLRIIKPENIAEQLKSASKPSRSSGQITMEMVGFVESLLDSVSRALFFIEPSASVLLKRLRHLRVFFTLTTKLCIEYESLQDLYTHVEDAAYTAGYLCFLGLVRNVDQEFSILLEKICPFRPELRQIYLSVLIELKSARSETMNIIYIFDFIIALHDDLRLRCDERIRWLQQGLTYLSGFLLEIEEDDVSLPLGHWISLRSHMEALAIEAAIAVYSTYDEEMNKSMELNHALFLLQVKFNHLKVEFGLIKLLNHPAIINEADRIDLTGYVWGELEFLRTSLMDALEQCNEKTKITVFLTFIQSATSQAWSVSNSLSHNSEQEDLAREINHLHFQLFLMFKFSKAAIREMLTSISASSSLDHPVRNLLNFLPINFEVISSYFSMLKSSKTSFSNSLKMDELLVGFREYILDNLLLKDDTSLTFTIANEVKKFYSGWLLLVTFLVDQDHSVQCLECKEEINLSMGFETIGIEAESAVSLSHEDVVDSNKCRNVNLVLQFLTVAFWLIKSEGNLMDLLKHKATLNDQVLDLLESAHEELIYLRVILMDLLRQHTKLNKFHDLLMHAEVTAQKIARISGTCYQSFIDGSIIGKMMLLLSDLLQEIEFVKVELRKVFFQVLDVSPCNVIDGQGLITVLLNNHDGSLYGSSMDGSSDNMGLSFSEFLQEIESVKVHYDGSFSGSSMDVSIDFPQEIEPVKVEEVSKICDHAVDASLCEMSKTDGDAGSISFLDNQISIVKDKLMHMGSFLADILQHRSMHLELNDLTKHVQDKGNVYFSSAMGYKPAWCCTLYLADAKKLLKILDAETKMICLRVPDSTNYRFPMTNGLGFLNCFFGELEEHLHSKLDSIIDLKHQIESVKEDLLCRKSLIDHLSESYDEHDEVCGLITSVAVMAYKAEYVIHSCLACSHPFWYQVLWISEVVEKIKLVNKVVGEVCETRKIDVTAPKAVKTSTYLLPSLPANTPRANEEMEGFLDVIDELKKQLLEGPPQLDVISIVGMPGLGKTTLAKKIYNDPIVTFHFDVRAQCRVTQVYSWRELLLTILNGVLEPADRNEKEDGELADELRRFLLTKRFLILIDDVWDNKVWDNLHMCFRDTQSGSRIILTTRLSDIASYAKCHSEPHHLRLFSNDESWSLLQKEVFQGKGCPPELEDVGYQIAKRCRGLPLSIVLVAGVLKQKKNKADLWRVVEETLGSKSIGSLEKSLSIIGFSYKNLPHHLRPCFLYFGGFLMGKDIGVSKLTRLWQAEGFIQANKEKGPKDAVQDFLEDLIGRNLVMGVEKRPNGKVRTCSIHDLLHAFCLEKAKQENFLLQINSGEDVLPEEPKEYRLFVHSYQDEIDFWRPSHSNIRSLLFNAIDLDNMSFPRDLSFIFDSFKLVKVLDLESFNIGGTFPSEIQYLTQMRYFAAQTEANSIPSYIAKLWNLETFVVRGLGGEMILPRSFLKMVKLRHIHVNHRVSFGLHENADVSLATTQLANLETFSTPFLSYGVESEKILRKMPKLRKLSCIFSGTFGYSRKAAGRCVRYPRLDFLSHLESLKVVSNSYPAKLPQKFNFPLQLRKLTLLKFRLPWAQISTISKLPNLEILKLCLRAFEGDHWEVNDSEFPELKYLKLDNLKVSQWSVSDDAFPKLEHLVLTKCKRLEKIPSHFEDAVCLRSIEVNWCSWSTADSAQEIQTTQREDMANDAFTVTIQPPDWASRSSP